ncbi:MAG TPA: hypothetical protein VGI03_16190 [Verrucomicrobiae bacterium]
MTSRALNKLGIILWIILLLSAAVFLILALLAPETQFLDSKGPDDWMYLIKTTTDIERLRNIAMNVVSFDWITGGTAIWLCRIAIGAFFIIMSGAVVGLLQVRKMKRQLIPPPNIARACVKTPGGIEG